MNLYVMSCNCNLNLINLINLCVPQHSLSRSLGANEGKVNGALPRVLRENKLYMSQQKCSPLEGFGFATQLLTARIC